MIAPALTAARPGNIEQIWAQENRKWHAVVGVLEKLRS